MSAQDDNSEPPRSTEVLEGEVLEDNEDKIRESTELSHFLARQEALLQTICDNLPSARVAKEELKLLQSIERRILSESSKTQFLWNVFLQFTGIIFVILFGVFAVLSYIIGKSTDRKSLEANQLAFLTLCLSSNSSFTNVICEEVLSIGSESLPSLGTTVWGPLQTSPGGSTTTLTDKAKILLGVASAVGVLVVFGATVWKTYQERFGESPEHDE